MRSFLELSTVHRKPSQPVITIGHYFFNTLNIKLQHQGFKKDPSVHVTPSNTHTHTLLKIKKKGYIPQKKPTKTAKIVLTQIHQGLTRE